MSKRFWLQWYSTPAMGHYQLLWPWWKVDQRVSDGAHVISAAVIAESADDAMAVVVAAYTAPRAVSDPVVEWRAVLEKPADWSPFCEEFKREHWMRWAAELRVRVGQAVTLGDLVRLVAEARAYVSEPGYLTPDEMLLPVEVESRQQPSLRATRTHTRTYAMLPVSEPTYIEVKRLLEEAGYDHAFHKQDDGRVAVDMEGVALVHEGLEEDANDNVTGWLPTRDRSFQAGTREWSIVDCGQDLKKGDKPHRYFVTVDDNGAIELEHAMVTSEKETAERVEPVNEGFLLATGYSEWLLQVLPAAVQEQRRVRAAMAAEPPASPEMQAIIDQGSHDA